MTGPFPLNQPGSAPAFVSVIIPVYNDRERLRSCLSALASQTYPRTAYELIVVDNGSDPPVGVEELPGDAARLLSAGGGSYAARNIGIAAARGSILAFTDADCLPSRDWLAEGVATLLGNPKCGLVAGRDEVFFADPLRPRAVELYEKAVEFRQDINVSREKYAVTANLFTRRDVLDRVGSFDGSLVSGGDTEWGARVFRAGYSLVYSPNAAVRHPARSFRQFTRKIARVAYGRTRLYGNREAGFRRRGWIQAVVPPVYRLHLIWRSTDLKGVRQRLAASSVAVLAKYLWAWHRLRYSLGLYDKGQRIS